MGVRLVPLPVSCACALAACSIEVSGLGDVDAGPDAGFDAAGIDAAGIDAGRWDASFDAGPPPDVGCHEFGTPRQVWTFGESGFRAAAATHAGTAVEAPGVLVIPAQPYRYGGLLAAGYEGSLLEDPPALTDVSGTPTGHAFIGDLDQTWSSSDGPAELLLAGESAFTVLAAGEIRLLSGPTTLEIVADDRAVIEIDVAGTTQRLFATEVGAPVDVSFTVPADRWYPIRLAFADDGGSASVRVSIAEGDDAPFVPGPDVLRADARSVDGREMLGFDTAPPDATLRGARVDPDDTDGSWGTGRPAGIGITVDDRWSARWISRWTFDVPDGTIRADTDGKHRVWVHGVYYGGEYAEGVANTTYALRVAPGTNDVVYELDEIVGDAFARIYANDAFVPPDRAVPASRFGGLAFGAGTRSGAVTIAAGAMETVTVEVRAPGSPRPTVAEVSGVIETSEADSITIRYTPPGGGGTTVPLVDCGEPAGSDRWVFRLVVPTPFETNGGWVVGAINAGASPATLRTAGVLAHHHADPEPYAADATFISEPLDLGERTRVTSVEIDAYTLFGTSFEIAVGAADDRAGLPSPWWSGVRADGTVDGDAVGRFMQLRVVLRGPRVDTPRVVELRAVGGVCLP